VHTHCCPFSCRGFASSELCLAAHPLVFPRDVLGDSFVHHIRLLSLCPVPCVDPQFTPHSSLCQVVLSNFLFALQGVPVFSPLLAHFVGFSLFFPFPAFPTFSIFNLPVYSHRSLCFAERSLILPQTPGQKPFVLLRVAFLPLLCFLFCLGSLGLSLTLCLMCLLGVCFCLLFSPRLP